jgi:hypothetical protein
MKDKTQAEYRSTTGAILTGVASGTASAVVTQAASAMKKKPKDDKCKK